MPQQTEAIEYIRNRYKKQVTETKTSYKPFGKPKGLLLAKVIDGNKLMFSWSLCHKRKDEFDPEFGLKIAVGRMIRDSKVPNGITHQFQRFIDRWTKYFADKNVVSRLRPIYADLTHEDEIVGYELVHNEEDR